MSYPSGLSDEQMKIMWEAINTPCFKKGDMVNGCILLEDAKAHGCPLVQSSSGEKRYMTMYGHRAIYEKLCKEKGISSEPENKNID